MEGALRRSVSCLRCSDLSEVRAAFFLLVRLGARGVEAEAEAAALSAPVHRNLGRRSSAWLLLLLLLVRSMSGCESEPEPAAAASRPPKHPDATAAATARARVHCNELR